MRVTLTVSIIVIFIVIFLWILTGSWIEDGLEPRANGSNDYAIILGAKVNGEKPSLSLQYRLDAALDYAKQYPHVYLILSGGQGAGEHISESEAMRRFLIENGIPRNGYWLKTYLLLHMKIYFIQPRSSRILKMK